MCAWRASLQGKWTERVGTTSLARPQILSPLAARLFNLLEAQSVCRLRDMCLWQVHRCSVIRTAERAAVGRRPGVYRPVAAICHARWSKVERLCAGRDIGEAISASRRAAMSINPKLEMRLVVEAWLLAVASAAPIPFAAIGFIETFIR